MRSSFIAFALIAAGIAVGHATDRCTDAQWAQALSSAPARDGSKLIAKTVLEDPVAMTFTTLVYDAQQEGFPLVCERQYSIHGRRPAPADAPRRAPR